MIGAGTVNTSRGRVVTSLLADAGTSMSQSSSTCASHSGLPAACKNEPPATSHRLSSSPPVSFVIVRDSGGAAPPSPIRASGIQSSLTRVQQFAGMNGGATAVSSPLDGSFKLQPRHSRCIPPGRGRKRGVGSISSTIFSDSTSHGYPNDKPVGEQDSVTTAPPEDDTITPPMTFFHPSAATPSDGVDHATASLHALTICTPRSTNGSASSFVGSHMQLLGRSSFSKYSGSPAGSLHTAESQVSVSYISKTSPGAKIAPLRVLSSVDSGATPLQQHAKDVGESSESMYVKPPPSVVHCTTSDTGVDTSFLEEDDEDYSAAKAPQCNCAETPSRKSVASMSEKTPLPKVSLTPRSQGSRASQLPRFPSPEEEDMDADFILHSPSRSRFFGMSPPRSTWTSQDVSLESFGFFVDSNVHDGRQDGSFDESSSGAPLENLEDGGPAPQRKAESFIPLPDWGSRFPAFPRTRHPNNMNAFVYSEPESSYNPHAITGLASIVPPNTVQLAQPTLDLSQDTGSLSASDDENAFFLVPPSMVADRGEDQHRSKQRRIHSETEKRQFSFAASAGHASNTSLLGMGFVPSSTSLHGLCSNNSPRGLDGSATFGLRNREGSSASIGLALDQAPNPEESRALMTPPIMPEAHSPPPLSPRAGVLRKSDD